MEDKVIEFMEKMYADLKQEIRSVKDDVQKVSNQVIKIEQEHGGKLDALLDGYKQLAEGQEEIKLRLDSIEKHMAHQDNEITFLKKAK